jgi:hypothetical protein
MTRILLAIASLLFVSNSYAKFPVSLKNDLIQTFGKVSERLNADSDRMLSSPNAFCWMAGEIESRTEQTQSKIEAIGPVAYPNEKTNLMLGLKKLLDTAILKSWQCLGNEVDEKSLASEKATVLQMKEEANQFMNLLNSL